MMEPGVGHGMAACLGCVRAKEGRGGERVNKQDLKAGWFWQQR